MKRAFKDIREFIELLDSIGELRRVGEPVSPEIEIPKIVDAESKKPGGGKALLFENVVDGGKRAFCVAANLFGSDRRMSLAIGAKSLAESGGEIAQIAEMSPLKSFSDIFSAAKKFFPLLKIFPKTVSGTPPCQEVAKYGDDVDLSEIPVLKCWPKDGGRFVTLPLVFTKSADGKMRNLGMYRLQIYDKNTTGMHWHVHKDGSHFFREYEKLGRRMEVTVAIGADPATIYAATAPLPRGADELLLAGFLRKSGVRLAKCKTVDLEVPADAEFVLEGYVDPGERRLEGPFGDHTGYYSLPDMYPVFHVTALTRKRNPVYCATLVGPPPMEDCYMAKATERIFLPLLRAVNPDIREYFLPWEGVFHNISIVSLRKEFPAHARRLASGIWGAGQMSFCKCVVAVGEEDDPSDLKHVWELFKNSFDPSSDMEISSGVLDALDHAAPRPLEGSKISIDLTPRLPSEAPRAPKPLKTPDGAQTGKISDFLRKELGGVAAVKFADAFCAVSLDKDGRSGRSIAEKCARSGLFDGFFRALAFFDAEIDVSDFSKMLWKIFNNTDPARDILALGSGLVIIDACKKGKADGYPREWPDDLSFDK